MNLFLDSGAHSLYNDRIRKAKDHLFYETDEFWKYVDDYCIFLKEHKDKFRVYVSVDVIFNSEMTWKVQRYMEDVYKLNPLPAFHAQEDFKWLKKYMDNYEYIGLGGLGQGMTRGNWLANVGEPAWNLICNEKGIPRVKIHGFAMTSPNLVIEFPYYSADSTSWMQFGKYGLLVIPRKKHGFFDYDIPPLIISVSTRKKRKDDIKNFDHLPKIEQTYVHEYLESIGLKMGSSKLEDAPFDATKAEFPIAATEVSATETIIEHGVCNDVTLRDQANLSYYLNLEEFIPPYPRPWKKKRIASMTKMPGA